MKLIIMSILLSLMVIKSWVARVVGLMMSVILSLMGTYSSWDYYEDGVGSYEFIGNLMIFLTLSVCLLVILAIPNYNVHLYNFTIIVLSLILIMTFSSTNLLSFYFFFELSLIPTTFLILSWGYQPERLQAGMYMMLYTVCASLPLLIFILWLKNEKCTLEMFILNHSMTMLNSLVWVVVCLAFLVKMPMYGVHLWLPKAHVEAPLAGSMILAGVLLKLGGYGLFIINKFIYTHDYFSLVLCFILSLSMWGGMLASLICISQVDIKAYVAYSSITHMAVVIVGYLINSSWGVSAATIMMVSHGFTSSAMFLLAHITYLKAGSRSLLLMGGFLFMCPILSLFWFIFNSINMAAPPSLNFISELMVISAINLVSLFLLVVFLMIMCLSVGYNMLLYVKINHGSPTLLCSNMSSSTNSCQTLSLVLHLMFLILIIKANLFF